MGDELLREVGWDERGWTYKVEIRYAIRVDNGILRSLHSFNDGIQRRTFENVGNSVDLWKFGHGEVFVSVCVGAEH